MDREDSPRRGGTAYLLGAVMPDQAAAKAAVTRQIKVKTVITVRIEMDGRAVVVFEAVAHRLAERPPGELVRYNAAEFFRIAMELDIGHRLMRSIQVIMCFAEEHNPTHDVNRDLKILLNAGKIAAGIREPRDGEVTLVILYTHSEKIPAICVQKEAAGKGFLQRPAGHKETAATAVLPAIGAEDDYVIAGG